jgi:hypothetical protein
VRPHSILTANVRICAGLKCSRTSAPSHAHVNASRTRRIAGCFGVFEHATQIGMGGSPASRHDRLCSSDSLFVMEYAFDCAGGDDQNVYLVVSDFGRLGLAWCETDVEATDLETIIGDLLGGQYTSPVRIVGFNVGEGWARDVSEDVADGIRRRCDMQKREVPAP